MQYIQFKTKDRYSTNDIFELIQILRQNSRIIITFFHPKKKECIILFLSDEYDRLLERQIQNFLDMEDM